MPIAFVDEAYIVSPMRLRSRCAIERVGWGETYGIAAPQAVKAIMAASGESIEVRGGHLGVAEDGRQSTEDWIGLNQD